MRNDVTVVVGKATNGNKQNRTIMLLKYLEKYAAV